MEVAEPGYDFGGGVYKRVEKITQAGLTNQDVSDFCSEPAIIRAAASTSDNRLQAGDVTRYKHITTSGTVPTHLKCESSNELTAAVKARLYAYAE